MPATFEKVIFSDLIYDKFTIMKSEIELTDQIEAYLSGQLSAAERISFERQRSENPSFDHKVVEHQRFLEQLSGYGHRSRLSADMESIHNQLDIEAIKEEVLPNSARVISLVKKYRINVAVAASVAILAVFTTLFFTGYFSKTSSSNYSALRREFSREINNIKRSQNALINNINNTASKGPVNPAQFGGTGFALSENGYVVTNYHVINGADSVYIQNSSGESFKAKAIYIDPTYDIAVLQVIDTSFKSFGTLPYTFKKSTVDIGEDVYTIGFSKDDPVYGKGYLSSQTGNAGDTTEYQVSIPVNLGNSGGPVLDDKGNVVGVIKGKLTQSDGAAFAIKSDYLLKSIEAIPQDSLDKKLILNKKSGLAGLSRTDQIKKMQDYIFMVKVY